MKVKNRIGNFVKSLKALRTTAAEFKEDADAPVVGIAAMASAARGGAGAAMVGHKMSGGGKREVGPGRGRG